MISNLRQTTVSPSVDPTNTSIKYQRLQTVFSKAILESFNLTKDNFEKQFPSITTTQQEDLLEPYANFLDDLKSSAATKFLSISDEKNVEKKLLELESLTSEYNINSKISTLQVTPTELTRDKIIETKYKQKEQLELILTQLQDRGKEIDNQYTQENTKKQNFENDIDTKVQLFHNMREIVSEELL